MSEDSRALRRDEADTALAAWLAECVDDVAELKSVALGALNATHVAVFYGELRDEDNDAAELLRVVLHGPSGGLIVDGRDGADWAEAVAVWADLRDVLGHVYQCPPPLGVFVDLRSRLVAGWCGFGEDDEVTGEPDLTPDVIAQVADEPRDAFEALLSDPDAEGQQAVQVVLATLAQIGLEPPVPHFDDEE